MGVTKHTKVDTSLWATSASPNCERTVHTPGSRTADRRASCKARGAAVTPAGNEHRAGPSGNPSNKLPDQSCGGFVVAEYRLVLPYIACRYLLTSTPVRSSEADPTDRRLTCKKSRQTHPAITQKPQHISQFVPNDMKQHDNTTTKHALNNPPS